MPRLKTVVKKIVRVEEFEVRFHHPDGRNMRSDRTGVPQYDYVRKAKGNMTVREWKDQRFYPNYVGFEIDVLNADGTAVAGNTRLSTVRDSY